MSNETKKMFIRTNYPTSITFTEKQEAQIAEADVIVVQSATENKVIAHLHPPHVLRDGQKIPRTDKDTGEFLGWTYYKVYNFG